MRYWRTIEAHCSTCNGSGQVMTDQIRSDGYWVSFSECHCVEHHHDDEMKAFLARVCSAATPQAKGEG